MVSRSAITGRVEGLEASRAALEAVIRAEVGAVPRALELIGEQAVTEIRRFAPVRTGTLRRSYTYEVGADGSTAWVEISSNVVYAPYQEFGTSRIVGTPHLRPGIDAVRPQVRALLAESMGRAGRGAVRGGGLAAVASRLGSLARGARP